MSDVIKNIFKGYGLFVLVLLIVVLLCFVGNIFIGISCELGVGGECIAVVFDKAAVMGADKIVAYWNGAVITITDQSLVREVASNFVVANRTALCESRSGDKLEIYNGDRLVRTVYWSDCLSNFAHIYEEDASHWILGEGSMGQLELPQDVYERIVQIIQNTED